MTASTQPAPSAHDVYVEKHTELMANLARLRLRIESHTMDEALNQRGWGYVGDITRINDLITQAGDILA